MSEAVHTDYYCFRLPFLRLLRMLRLDYLSLLKMMNNLKNSIKKIHIKNFRHHFFEIFRLIAGQKI